MNKRPIFDGKAAELGDVPSDLNGCVKRLRRSPSDEMLLTEVGIDDEKLVIYDITGLYSEIEKGRDIVHCHVKSFKN